MRVACEHCRTKYTVDDQQVAAHSRVQFRCGNCGQTTVLDLGKRPERTQAVSPRPSFARGDNAPDVGGTIVSQYQGLALPADKLVTVAVIGGPSKGLSHPMTKPRVVVGRKGGGADIEIDDQEVSRWHCAVEVKGDVVRLRDLDSTNGTFVEEERVRAAELQHLSEFRIGSSTLLVTITTKLD